MFKITKEWIEEFQTQKGGYYASQIKALGLSYPMSKGWKKKIVGKEITDEQKQIFEAGHASKSQARRLTRQLMPKIRREKKAKKTLYTYSAPPAQFVSGVRVESDAFLGTYEWRRVRMVALKKYGARCQCCGASPADGATMNVDHIKPRKLFPHLALDVDNLQILCHLCNHGKGNWDMTDWRQPEELPLDDDQASHIRSILKE